MSKKINEINKNKSVKTSKNSFLSSVDRFNGTTLFFIIVLTAIVVFVSCILLFSNKKYLYLPDYEVMSYSEDINPAVIVISSYSEVDDDNDETSKITKSNRVILSLTYVEKSGNEAARKYKISDLRANFIGVVDKSEYEYLTEYTNEDTMPNASARTHQFASTTTGSKFDYKTILGELKYKIEDNEGKEETKLIQYKTQMIELTDEDMDQLKLDDKNPLNTFTENSNYFSSYSVYQEVSESDEVKTKKMYSTISLKIANLEKYVFDYQMFAIDDEGNVDPMVGYYNVSTNVKATYSRSTSVPFDKEYKYLVAKGILKYEENGETKELVLYSKKVIE